MEGFVGWSRFGKNGKQEGGKGVDGEIVGRRGSGKWWGKDKGTSNRKNSSKEKKT